VKRQDIFKEVGKLYPSRDEKGNVSFSSVFIVPVAHNVHNVQNIVQFFDEVKENWEIKNDSMEKDLRLAEIKEYVKKDSFGKIEGETDSEKIKRKKIESLKNIIYDKKNLYLCYKKKNIVSTYKYNYKDKENKDKYEEFNIFLKEIDLWIMDGHIAFFAYKIALDPNSSYDIDTLSSKLNRSLRDFKELTIDIENAKLYFKEKENQEKENQEKENQEKENQEKDNKEKKNQEKDKGVKLFEYLLSLTTNKKGVSFLNLPQKDSTLHKDLLVIENSTYYAKMLTALHIDEKEVVVGQEKYPLAPLAATLSERVMVDVGILEECSYLLGTTSSYDFAQEMGFVANEGYAYSLIQNNGINIWKFWSGVALQDSVAFFSVADGGQGIVYASASTNYFMYIINLYISTRLKFIENFLIDKDFINIERVLPSVREIQVLKNHYIANEIAVKFQPNYINDKIAKGLQNAKLLAEVEKNLHTTFEITKNNTDVVFSLGAGVATLGSMWLTGDNIAKLYETYPIATFGGVVVILVLVVVVASKKSFVIRKIKQLYKRVIRLFGL